MTESNEERQRTEATNTDERGESANDDEEPATDLLDDVQDGSGCTEIWEHLSEQRNAEVAENAN